MTIYALGAQGIAGSGDLLTREGGPPEAAPWMYRPALWYPNSTVRGANGPDTLFMQDFEDEREVLERGGRMSTDVGNYWQPSTAKADLVAGPFLRKALGEKVAATGQLLIPAVGLIDPLDYTVEFRVKPKGADGNTLTGNLLWLGTVQSNTGVAVYKPATTTQIVARQYRFGVPSAEVTIAGLASVSTTVASGGAVGTVTVTPTTTSGMVAGQHIVVGTDWRRIVSVGGGVVTVDRAFSASHAGGAAVVASDLAADAWTAVSVTVSGTTLTLRLGDNSKSASATITPLPWWAFEDGEPAITPLTGGGRASLSGAFEIAELHIGPARVPGPTADYVSTAAVSVDFDDDASSVELPDLGGLFAQYPGWRDTSADGQTGGGGTGVTGNAIRDVLFETVAADGCKLVRIDHGMGKALALLDEPMQLLHDLGMKFHISLSGTPSALRGAGGENAVPTSNAAFAQEASDRVTHWKALGFEFFLTGWNEPEITAFWAGTDAQMATLWLAVQAKLATDHPDIEFGGTDSNVAPASATNPNTKVLVEAGLAGRPMPFTGYHAYNPEYEQMAAFKALREFADANGYEANMPIRLGEWNPVESTLWTGNTSPALNASLLLTKGHPTAGVDMTAKTFRKMANFAEDGYVLSATFTRMGILDTFFAQGEQLLGAFTHESPPRPTAAYPAFQAIWKCVGQQVATTVTRPRLKAVAARNDDTGVLTLAYGSHRAWDPERVERHAFEWAGLPAEFTWRMWRCDARDSGPEGADWRLTVVAEGTETNLPLGTDLTAQGVGCIQITPS